MIIFKSINKLNKEVNFKANIGFVPTMGALHKGHISLIKSSKKNVIKFVNSLKLFGYGYSWGGFESLALHQEIKEQGDRSYLNLSKDEHIVRLHIGLEDPKDLIEDLRRSLKFIK